AGLSNASVVEYALISVEPAIGAPQKTVQAFVCVLIAKAIQESLGKPVGNIVVIAIRNKEQLWRRSNPDAATPNFQPTDEVETIGEFLASLDSPIPIAVLEDHDFVQTLSGGALGWVAVSLSHPHPAALIKSEGDGLMQVRFGDDKLSPESSRHVHLGNRLFRRRPGGRQEGVRFEGLQDRT